MTRAEIISSNEVILKNVNNTNNTKNAKNAKNAKNLSLNEIRQDLKLIKFDEADIPIAIDSIKKKKDNYLITTKEEILNPKGHYILKGKNLLPVNIEPSVWDIILTVVIGSALINNFVFTRYLGLCVFFGVSKKKETAIGMGFTFIIISVLSGLFAWILQYYALAPLKINFLQIIAFIGIVACLVQASESIMKKIHPNLYRKFGIYLMLVTTNCIILAVPLLNATNHSSFWEATSLAFGSGLGFAIALFLMSSAREKIELAPVPAIFQGLPIAFIIAGLFALSFLGFSGLKIM